MSNYFRKIVTCYQPVIDSITNDLLSKAGFPRNGIKAFVVKQRKGHSIYHPDNIFSVPLWAYFRSREYFTYYVAHELAHIISHKHNDYTPGHKEPFYKYFKMICPKEYWHYETKYIKSSGQYFKEIYVGHSFSRGRWIDKQWFNRTVPCQSAKYPRGITKAQALQIAGKNGTVYKVIATRQRIK